MSLSYSEPFQDLGLLFPSLRPSSKNLPLAVHPKWVRGDETPKGQMSGVTSNISIE